MAITESSGNVFEDLGLENAEELHYKSHLVMALKDAIKFHKFTQTKAAKVCGTDQPTLSKVLRGQIDKVTTDRLFRWLGCLGLGVRITLDQTPKKGVQVCTCS
ncbi:transcriptional regulator [Pseudodesulfovibrio nedwellii]|uniref:Transcriptional regulator n=1 Tax=Pseudodesulfovibrio nedwellii TaxID=2973072 RepID=A0ABN6S1U4_9BACT|nr:helix-turn-helix transcriptional regulator [Pseudodesulfovibrio nedwellii]BDQ35913.1 transcriptional regulator [Pseudodesulfovibrio nedwellii]BDQ36320.1 transcriptional regulator [Pseudodesulfovibrio nedwellii]